MSSRYEILATRALNQYRRRDVVSYLGLRYYLENKAARTDRWAKEVATDLSLRQSLPSYLKIKHFKDIDSKGNVFHRDIHLPGPNEMLAESALIDECSLAGAAFIPGKNVYSYRPATGTDTSGIFVHYMHGLKSRHAEISRICSIQNDVRVAFFDIKRFYPSIPISVAEKVWSAACLKSRLSTHFTELGRRLIWNHQAQSGESGNHLLTGPMFSHLIGNLVLAECDELLSNGPSKYLRYVDDLTLIGTPSEIDASLQLVKASLDRLGLELHPESSAKTQNIGAEDWLKGEHDFVHSHRKSSWMSLIGDLKRILVLQPEKTEGLVEALRDRGIRLPVPDYSAAASEREYQWRLQSLLSFSWFRKITANVTIRGIVDQATQLSKEYAADLEPLLEMNARGGHEAKRSLPKLRYRVGRLIYLAEPDVLKSVSLSTKNVVGLELQSTIANSVATGDLAEVMKFGTNASQAAAQAMRISSHSMTMQGAPQSAQEWDSLAMFKLNGLSINTAFSESEQTALFAFAANGVDRTMMRNKDQFIQEIACLHGLSTKPRHTQMLAEAFDVDQDISFDAVEQSQNSLSG